MLFSICSESSSSETESDELTNFTKDKSDEDSSNPDIHESDEDSSIPDFRFVNVKLFG